MPGTENEAVHELHRDERLLSNFCGRNDARLREIEQELNVRIVTRGAMMKIVGEAEQVRRTASLIEDLIEMFAQGGQVLPPPQMRYAINSARDGKDRDLRSISADQIDVQIKGRRIAPMTAGQKFYVESIRENDIVFGIGPAGTGKTYLAMAMAVNALITGEVRRIILARPAVEAGEKLGFLPGDLAAKVDPYLRPLYDALYDMMDAAKVMAYLESGIIEIAPLAFMRGRTLNDAFIVLDEGQNTSVEQMKMFLTRLGFDSKAVITGDVSQIDLEHGRMSGLVHSIEILQDVDGIAFVEFQPEDIVRHSLVQRIVDAYDRDRRAERPRPPFVAGRRASGGGQAVDRRDAEEADDDSSDGELD